MALLERVGKVPIRCAATPGFIVPRIQALAMSEVARMVDEGVASAEDIDRAMTLGYRHPMGPLRLTDLVGCDVRMAIGDHLADALDAPQFRPPELLRRMVAGGKLGRKSGQGFYTWEK